MTTMLRILVYLSVLILLGVGIRLMYYGLETVVGASPHYSLSNVLLMLIGVLFFICGIIAGILFMSPPRSPTHN
ncbi:MAG TPA: hypothetical protein VGD98_08405 [Ktedonobacteraceae bacterium]